MNNAFIKKITDNVNISLLSKIALVLTAISCITLFVGYSVVDYAAEERMYELSFNIPSLIEIFSLLEYLTPYILLTLFFSKNRDKIKVPVLLCIVFGLLSISCLLNALDFLSYDPVCVIIYILLALLFALIAFSSIYFKQYRNRLDITVVIPTVFVILAYPYVIYSIRCLADLEYVIAFRDISYSFWMISYLLLAVLLVLSTISALKGLSRKIFAIIALSVGLLLEVVDLVDFILRIGEYVENGRYLYLLTPPVRIVGVGTLYLTLLIFVLNNRIPSIMSHIIMSLTTKKEKNITPEQALKTLKENLDFGTITEEEYQAQRAEIISKL